MGEQGRLLELERRPESEDEAIPAVPLGELKLRRPERRQIVFGEIDVERLVAEDHPVRAIWELSGRLDLSGFALGLRSRLGAAGRRPWDPRLLTAIWIWAYSQAISSAREIERQSKWRPELRWLCGLEVVNHHSLSDFRVENAAALEEIFTQVLAALSAEGLVELEQVAVDGTRLRSQGSTSSERRRGTIERHLSAAREAVEKLSRAADEDSQEHSARRQAARKRAAAEKLARLKEALDEVVRLEARRAEQHDEREARVSETEPEARRQRESNGGYGLGYNAQFATDAKEKIVVGVELTATASDGPQLQPALADVERRLGRKPRQALADEGYNSRANIEALAAAGIEFATPAPELAKGKHSAARAAGIAPGYEAQFFIWDEGTGTFRCPAGKRLEYRRMSQKRGRKYRQYQAKRSDCMECEQRQRCCPKSYERGRTVSCAEEDELMARHREWMQSERAKAAYRRRAETAEFPNAWLKERFGVRKFRVRGLLKARMELLWAMLAYNVAQWVRLVWRGGQTAAAAA
jgi:transposase